MLVAPVGISLLAPSNDTIRSPQQNTPAASAVDVGADRVGNGIEQRSQPDTFPIIRLSGDYRGRVAVGSAR
jgi:hypothetical protein